MGTRLCVEQTRISSGQLDESNEMLISLDSSSWPDDILFGLPPPLYCGSTTFLRVDGFWSWVFVVVGSPRGVCHVPILRSPALTDGTGNLWRFSLPLLRVVYPWFGGQLPTNCVWVAHQDVLHSLCDCTPAFTRTPNRRQFGCPASFAVATCFGALPFMVWG